MPVTDIIELLLGIQKLIIQEINVSLPEGTTTCAGI